MKLIGKTKTKIRDRERNGNEREREIKDSTRYKILMLGSKEVKTSSETVLLFFVFL